MLEDFNLSTGRPTNRSVIIPRQLSKNWSENMGRANKLRVSVHEIPPEVIGGLVISELAQIRTDAETHPDPDAKRRLLASANMLQEIAQNQLSRETLAEI